MPDVLFVKTELQNLYFSVCHVVSRLVTPSFSMADSLISADVLSTARECYKNTFSKVIFHICCNKNRLEAENIFLREESTVKSQNDSKKIRVGDLSLGTLGNRKHTYFFVWPYAKKTPKDSIKKCKFLFKDLKSRQIMKLEFFGYKI